VYMYYVLPVHTSYTVVMWFKYELDTQGYFRVSAGQGVARWVEEGLGGQGGAFIKIVLVWLMAFWRRIRRIRWTTTTTRYELFSISISAFGEEFYAYYLWNSIAFFATSVAAHTLVNGLLYDTSSITDGYFYTNVDKVYILADYCTTEVCWSVHVASCGAILASAIQVLTVFCVKKILFRTKHKSGKNDWYSMSNIVDGETQML
jgi:hypothetical protein